MPCPRYPASGCMGSCMLRLYSLASSSRQPRAAPTFSRLRPQAAPRTFCPHATPTGEQLVYGDSKGEVNMLLCGTREWPARDLISTDEHQDYLTVHKEHADWISQVCTRKRPADESCPCARAAGKS